VAGRSSRKLAVILHADVVGSTALVQETLLGRLVTVGPEGALHIGLFPFIIGADSFHLHLNKNDEQLADPRSNDRCLFEVDEVLAVVPSHWEHPENAAKGTAYYRAAVFECTAKMSADPEKLAEHLRDIMERYQPEGGYRPIAASDPMYEGMIGMLEKVSLEIGKRRWNGRSIGTERLFLAT
jgi:hypothetical protein